MNLIEDIQTCEIGSQSMPALGSYDRAPLKYFLVVRSARNYGALIAWMCHIHQECYRITSEYDLCGFSYILNDIFVDDMEALVQKYYQYFIRSCLLEINIPISSSQLELLFFIYKTYSFNCNLHNIMSIGYTPDIDYLTHRHLLTSVTINDNLVLAITNYGFHILENKLSVPLLESLLKHFRGCEPMFPYFLVQRLINRLPIAELPKYLVVDNKYVRKFAAARVDQFSQ